MAVNEPLIQVWIRPCSVEGNEKWEQWPSRVASTKMNDLARDICTILYNDATLQCEWETNATQLKPNSIEMPISNFGGKLIKLIIQTKGDFWINFV